MLARKNHEKTGLSLPNEWKQEVIELLNSIYSSQCQEQGRKFDIFGLLYDTECLIIASFLDENNLSKVPITCFISTDISPHQKSEKIFSKLIDAAGVFFDNVLSVPDWDEYSGHWEETKLDDLILYYKFTRENIAATLEADKLLAQFKDLNDHTEEY